MDWLGNDWYVCACSRLKVLSIIRDLGLCFLAHSFLVVLVAGLNTEVDRILEIACIITDGYLTKSVEVLFNLKHFFLLYLICGFDLLFCFIVFVFEFLSYGSDLLFLLLTGGYEIDNLKLAMIEEWVVDVRVLNFWCGWETEMETVSESNGYLNDPLNDPIWTGGFF